MSSVPSIRRLYAGFGLSVIGIVAYRAFYFGLYDLLKQKIPRNNYLMSFLLGWTVTIVAGLLTYPLDTIRRYQMCFGTGTIQTINDIGFFGLFHGAGTNVMRGITGAFILSVYDQIRLSYTRPRVQEQEQNVGGQQH